VIFLSLYHVEVLVVMLVCLSVCLSVCFYLCCVLYSVFVTNKRIYNNKGTHGHLAKLSKPRCQKGVRKYFFSHRVINRWNAVDRETVSSSSINAFKNRLNKIRMTRMGYFMD